MVRTRPFPLTLATQDVGAIGAVHTLSSTGLTASDATTHVLAMILAASKAASHCALAFQSFCLDLRGFCSALDDHHEL